MDSTPSPLITNDAVVLGILMVILGLVFWTSGSGRPFWNRFYSIVPSLLVCYFVPSLLSTVGLFSAETSNLYFVASRYLLPASLVLLTMSIDLPGILRLGPKALIMFVTGTAGIVIGGPTAMWIVGRVDPALIGGAGPDAVWRGLATIAGSWIGGGANQAAMYEVFGVSDSKFAAFVAVDIIVGSIWMACLLWAAGRAPSIDRWFRADVSAIDDLKQRVSEYQASIAKIPGLRDTMVVLAVGFGVMAISHLVGGAISGQLGKIAGGDPEHFLSKTSLTSNFFWLIVLATTGGLLLSFVKNVRRLEGVGASRVGSVFIYVLVATIGMKMDLKAIVEHPDLFAIGLVWISIHAGLLILVGWLIRAPVFFLAVGSQANVGGAASAPIVASAFHPALAPVGVLLAVLGYALGTYAAWLCAILMSGVAP
jgi:uncharacterized membrane protein